MYVVTHHFTRCVICVTIFQCFYVFTFLDKRRRPQFTNQLNVNQSREHVLVLNDMCCGTFRHNHTTYRMYPLSSIIAPLQIWREIINLPPDVQRNFSISALADELEREFGNAAFGESARGNDVWYLDQKLISIRIQQWQNRTAGI